MQAYFDNTWMLTESLFAGLQGEEAFLRMPAHGLRHPLLFYYGHPATLYVNKLRAAGILQVREAPAGGVGLVGHRANFHKQSGFSRTCRYFERRGLDERAGRGDGAFPNRAGFSSFSPSSPLPARTDH